MHDIYTAEIYRSGLSFCHGQYRFILIHFNTEPQQKLYRVIGALRSFRVIHGH